MLEKVITNQLNMKFVYILPGSFMMGDSDNQHKMTLTKGFCMQITEVTQGQWKAVMGNNPSLFKDCGDDCPVESVSWYDVQEFTKELNQMEGKDMYRLPTEAEWEYTCRAGSTSQYCFGNDKTMLSEYAWFDGNSKGKTHQIAIKKHNEWGLYDMHGNVWEWCEDWFDNEKKWKVVRGGSWFYTPVNLRASSRFRFDPGYRSVNAGFRCAMTFD